MKFELVLLTELSILISIGVSCDKGETNKKTSGLIKVCTYNIEYDNAHNWSARKESIGELLQRYDWDIMGVQEPYLHQINDIMSFLPEYSYFGSCVTCLPGTSKDEILSNLIIYKKNRFDVLDSGIFWYSETPEIPSKGWDAQSTRMCIWIKFKDKITGKEFFHFNSHFDVRGATARVESAKLLVAKVSLMTSGFPVILTGDFNSSQSSEAYRTITSSGSLGDSFRWSEKKDNPDWPTYNDYEYSTIPKSSTRIDHVFFTPGNSRVAYWKIVNDAFSKKYPSDHFPVMIHWDPEE